LKSPVQIYLDCLKRVNIESMAHLEKALNSDLDIHQFKALCEHFKCNCEDVAEKVAQEIGFVPKSRKRAAS